MDIISYIPVIFRRIATVSNKAHLITGFSKNRRKYDYYPTPAPGTMALLENESFSGDILEPCAGAGHISKILESKFPGQKILSYDIRTEGIYGTGGIDFLKHDEEFYGTVDNIITNPPYLILEQFIQHSKKIARHKIAMLLTLQALGGKNHLGLIWADQKFPLKKVIIIPDRLKFQLYKNSSTMYHLWAVWDKFHKGDPIITWHQKQNTTLPLFEEKPEAEDPEEMKLKEVLQTEAILLQTQIELEKEMFIDA